MSFDVRPFENSDRPEILALSLRAWQPVFARMELAVPAYVYQAFYPEGWRARQSADIERILDQGGDRILVAAQQGALVGWVALRLHPDDRMGEIHILAVDPTHQRRGVAAALMREAFERMRAAGMAIAMVETGDDPGHAPSRAAYESVGFERWPVARFFRPL